MAFAYVATVPSAMVFFGFFFLDFFFQNRPHPKKKIFFFFGENFCDVEKKNFFWARQRDKWHFVARLESLVALVALSVVIVWATKDFISEEINEKYNKEYDRLYFSKRSSEYNELHS